MSESPKWYVIHTYSGYENMVAQSIERVVENRKLQDLIPRVLVPKEKVERLTKTGKKEITERLLFPGYVLVKMILTDDSWYVVRNIRGVTSFVGPGSKPVPLTDKEVEKLGVDSMGEEDAESAIRVEVSYEVGDTVVIRSGSLEGSMGVVHGIDLDGGTVDVVVQMLGRDTHTTLSIDSVVKSED